MLNIEVLDQITEHDKKSSRRGSSYQGLFKVDSSNDGSESINSAKFKQYLMNPGSK